MDRVPGGRYCDRCAHRVVDLSLMTDLEVHVLATREDGSRVCVSARFRPDGTLVTQDYLRKTTCMDPARALEPILSAPASDLRVSAARVELERTASPPRADVRPSAHSSVIGFQPALVPVSALTVRARSQVQIVARTARKLGDHTVDRPHSRVSPVWAGGSLMLVLAACAPHGGVEDLGPVDPTSEVLAPHLIAEEVTIPSAPELGPSPLAAPVSLGEGETPCDPEDVDLLDGTVDDEGTGVATQARRPPLRGVVRRPPPPDPNDQRILGFEG